MINNEDLTEIDKEKLFQNKEIQSEIWRNLIAKDVVKDRYLVSSTGRCYDYITKEFVKLYLFKGEGSYWYLERENKTKKEQYIKVLASELVRNIFYLNNYSLDIKQSFEESIEIYAKRIEFHNKIIKDYKNKRNEIEQKYNEDMKYYNDMILSEQYKINNTVSLLNTIKKASEKRSVKEEYQRKY